MRFFAFPVTEYEEVLSGCQLGQMVEQWKNQCFEDHLCPHPQGTSLTSQPFDLAGSLRELHHTYRNYLKGCDMTELDQNRIQ
jgi:hypothetical protein